MNIVRNLFFQANFNTMFFKIMWMLEATNDRVYFSEYSLGFLK